MIYLDSPLLLLTLSSSLRPAMLKSKCIDFFLTTCSMLCSTWTTFKGRYTLTLEILSGKCQDCLSQSCLISIKLCFHNSIHEEGLFSPTWQNNTMQVQICMLTKQNALAAALTDYNVNPASKFNHSVVLV